MTPPMTQTMAARITSTFLDVLNKSLIELPLKHIQ
jgi:hypothetical protein